MKNSRLIFIFLIIAITAIFASAQVKPFTGRDNPRGNNQRNRWMKELGLSQKQFQKIRTINRQTRPLKRQAGLKLREARQRLNQAIYSDAVNEDSVRANVNEVVEAQAEVTKINAMHELRVRQVLTANQLTRFRELRKKVAQRRRQRAKPRNQNRKRRQQRNRPPDDRQPPKPFK